MKIAGWRYSAIASAMALVEYWSYASSSVTGIDLP